MSRTIRSLTPSPTAVRPEPNGNASSGRLELPDRTAVGEGSQPEGASGRGRNGSIEGLRGFSASIVILYHLHNMAILGGFFHPFSSASVEAVIAGVGPFGVLLFFMISGYLILQSLIKYNDIPRFFKHRAIRIYPVFLALHLLIFALGPWSDYAWMGALCHSAGQYAVQFLSNALFLPGIFPLPLAQKNAWSLSYEFAFYLTAALLYFAAARRVSHPRLSRAVLLSGLTAGGAVLYTHPLACFFVGGVAVYLAGSRCVLGWGKPRTPQWLGAALLALTFAAFVRNGPWLSVVFGTLFFATVVSEAGIFSAWLRIRPLQYLGRISYSLYLVHPFVLDPLRAVIRHLAPHMHSEAAAFAVFCVFGFGGSVIVAGTMYRLIEVRFTNHYLRPLIS